MSRIRANNITNQEGNGAPNAPNGLVVAGVITATNGVFSNNVSIGGTLTYEDVTNIDSVGIITARSGINISTGSLTIPDSIIHSGDTNTKIRFPAADVVSFETGGSERVRIASGGSVGIGTDDPQQDIHLLKDGLSRVRIETTSTSQNADIIFHDPDGLQGVIGYNATKSSIDVDFRNTTEAITFSKSGAEKVRIETAANGDALIGINSNPNQGVYAIDANSSLLNGGISYNCDGSPYGATNLKLTLSNRDSGSHYFRFGYSDNMNTRGMIQYYRPNLASSEDELRFWVGGAEKIRFTSTGGIGIATVGDGSTNGSIGVGSTGQVLTSQGPGYPSIWKGGFTRILEQISAPCTGESVMTSFGPRVIQDTGTAGYQLTSTWTDLLGSQITYRPPTGTHTVIYKFSFQVSNHDADGISHYKFYVDGNEILWARYTVRADDFQNRVVFEWPIRIDSANANNYNHARLQTWDSDLVLKMQAREYSGSYEMKVHMTQNWDGAGTDQFSMPTISVTALGS